MADFTTDGQKIDFLRLLFGDLKVARDGNNVAVKCPSCGEKKKKFSINIQTWMCHCWVCGLKSKNLYYVLKKYKSESLASDFKTRSGKIIFDNNQEDLEVPVATLPENTVMLAAYSGSDPDIIAVRSYCKRRGLADADFWYFKISASFQKEFRRKVIIPSFDSAGKINYFVSRTIDKKGFPKYINSKVRKTDIIFNEINIDWGRELTIVEGPFDLVKADQNSTCLLGSKLSESSALFNRIIENRTPVLLALDSDMQNQSDRIASSLSAFGVSVRIADLRGASDVGELKKGEFKKIKNDATAWSRESSLKYKIRSIKSGSIF